MSLSIVLQALSLVNSSDWKCPAHKQPVPPTYLLQVLLGKGAAHGDVFVDGFLGEADDDHVTWLVGWATAGLFALVAILVSGWLIVMHLRNWTRPALQRHIARILFMVPSYAVCAFVSYRFPDYAIYINLYRDVYEGFAVYSFFSLCLLYLGHTWDEQRESMRGSVLQRFPPPMCCFRYDPKIPNFLLYCKLGIVQLFILRCCTSTFTVVMNHFGVFCEASMSWHFGHFWAVLLNSVSMGFSMFTLLSFYLAVHHDLPPGRPIYQFFAIKFVLFVSYLQMFTLTFLVGMGVIKGTDVYSPSDVITAIAGFLTCVEMAFAAIVNCSVFSWKEFAVDDDAAVRRLSAAAAGFLIDWDTGVDGVGENAMGSNGRRRGSSRWRQTGRLGMLDAFVDFAKPDDLWDDGGLILRSLIAWVRGGGASDVEGNQDVGVDGRREVAGERTRLLPSST